MREKCREQSWCGQCYSNVKGRSNYKGHRLYRAVRRPTFEGIEMALRKRDRVQGSGENGMPPGMDQLAKKLPFLWEFLAVDQYEDGSKRMLGTLILFVDGSLVKAFANDRDAGLSACVSSVGLWAVLEAVNAGLEADTLEWRSSDKGKKRK